MGTLGDFFFFFYRSVLVPDCVVILVLVRDFEITVGAEIFRIA